MKTRHSTDAQGFADLLKKTSLPALLTLGERVIEGEPGVADRIQYNRRKIDLLESAHEYTFHLNKGSVQVSLQLYENIADHYRLFCYTRAGNKQGMVFSVNLTTQQENNEIPLRQQIRFIESHPGSISEAQLVRRQKQADFCTQLAALGFDLEGTSVTLGTYDTIKQELINQSAASFLHDFLVVSLLKGHYQGNKGYELA